MRLDETDGLKKSQEKIVEKLGKPGMFNKHLAVLLGNHFNPTCLGYKVNDSRAVQLSVSRMLRLQVESASLYMVVFVPEQMLNSKQDYWQSLAFYLKGCYRMNEFLKHADFMSDSRYLSHYYQYLREDVLGERPYAERYPK